MEKKRINIKYGNVFEDYFYRSSSNTIILPSKEYQVPHPFHLFSVLHELGHSLDKPRDEGRSSYSDYQINREVFAWDYARSCVKKEYLPLLEDYAILCIGNYLNETSEFEVSQFEINNKIEINKT